MKKQLLVIFALVAAFNIGCQPKNTSKTKVTARAVRGGVQATQNVAPTTGSQVTSSSNQQWGQITRAQNWDQNYFQMSVARFLSNLSEPDGSSLGLGVVSGDTNQSTGIRFFGSVQGNGSQVTGGSLRISIVDSYVGQTNSNGEAITEIPIYIANGVEGFKGVSGTISQSGATITFADSFGSITLQGQFSGNWFYGTVSFSNSFQWVNKTQQSPGQSGYLGAFAIPTCSFFTCQ